MTVQAPERPAESCRKGVIVILDGLGDRPVPSLGGKTPLEAAATPTMNRLAVSGRWGLVQTTPEACRPHTHTGVGFLFGLSAQQAGSLARGPIEFAGLGLPYAPGDIMFRGNLASLEHKAGELTILDRRAGRINQATRELAQRLHDLDLGGGIRGTFIPTHQHRGVVRLTGPALSPAVSNTDPGNVAIPAPVSSCEPTESGESALRTATAMNRFTALAFERLKNHPVNLGRTKAGLAPANGVIARSAGDMVDIASPLSRNGLRTAVVTGCGTVTGLARMFGFDVVTDERFSGDPDTDIRAKMEAVLSSLEDHDLLYLHIKGPDVYAHDRDPIAKRDLLERIDHEMKSLIQPGLVIALCADHGTDSNTGRHISDPVPALLSAGSGQAENAEINFGETTCANGPLGRIDARDFLHAILGAMGIDIR